MPDGLAALARPSGAFAMLALDQRESLRTMLARGAPSPVPDAELVTFKVEAARVLSPFASAVLLDVDYGVDPVLEAEVIAPGAGLIVAADRLIQAPGGPVEETATDTAVLADERVATLADAYKLLVIWRTDGDEASRGRTVEAFVEGCRARGKPAIVEGIVRAGSGQVLGPTAHAALVLEAARELGALGPDLYKAEVPTLGAGSDDAITEAARQLSEVVAIPWVVLSNGTPLDRFAGAALAACRGGASGFLAGRGIWLDAIAAPDRTRALETTSAERLRALASGVDQVARPWWMAMRSAGT